MMIYKDSRLASFHDQVNEIHFGKYKTVIANNPFQDMDRVVNLIVLQLSEKILEDRQSQCNLSKMLSQKNLTNVVELGDVFYEDLFKENEFIPKERIAEKLKPLTSALSSICGDIWGQKQPFEESLTVFRSLEESIAALVGERLVNDERFYGLRKWEQLTECFPNSGPFFHALIDHLPENVIRSRLHELAYSFHNEDIFYEIEVLDKRNTKEQYARAYQAEAERMRAGSAWKYVSRLIKDAPYAMFYDNLSLRQSLVYRLSLQEIAEWIDGLRMPLSQAAAFHSLRDLRQMEEFVAQLIAGRENLHTPFIYLLLIALEHYFKLIHEISRNLQNLSGEIHHYDEQVKSVILSKGRTDYDEWITNGISDSLEKVIRLLFSDKAMLSPEYYQGIFDWVTSQDKAQWLANQHEKPLALAINLLQEKFLHQFKTGIAGQKELLNAIQADELNWTKLHLLMSLYCEDRSNELLRSMLTDKMLSFLRSDGFSWNLQYVYHDDVMNQAVDLALLLIERGQTEEKLKQINDEFKLWHEGWNYRIGQDFRAFNKQLYVLHVGIAAAYIHFSEGRQAEGRSCFDTFFKLTLQQYRNTVMDNYRHNYLLAVRFIMHVLLKFMQDSITVVVSEILAKIEDIEDVLIIASGLADTAKLLKAQVDKITLQAILDRIDQDYWIIESQAKLANHLSKLSEYKKMRKNFIDFTTVQMDS